MRRLLFAAAATVAASGLIAGSTIVSTAAAAPAAVTHTFDFDNSNGISEYDDGYTSGYWVEHGTAVAHSGTNSVGYKIRSFNSTGRVWIELDTPNSVQSSALPVQISAWVYLPATGSTSGAAVNPWKVAAYAGNVEPHNHAGHAPTAGWSYAEITNTAGAWKQYTFNTTVNTSADATVRTAVGFQANWPATRTHYIDDVTVSLG